MPRRWERELRSLQDVPAPLERIRDRAARGSEGPRHDLPPRGQRLAAGLVAVAVFLGAGAFAVRAWQSSDAPAIGDITTSTPPAWLVDEARHMAATNQDPSPTSARWVLTDARTAAPAVGLTSDQANGDARYLVVLEGQFTGVAARTRSGADPPTGTTLVFTLDPASHQVLDWSITSAAIDVAGLVPFELGGVAPLAPDMAGLTASCGGSVFDRLPPDTSAFAPFTSFDELDLSRVGGEAPFLREFISGYEWFVTQEGEDWRQLFGEPSDPDGDPPYASMRIEMGDGGWGPVGWGQCRIELDAEGWGNARFVVDPETPPDPEADRISVLATEMACASGQAPEGREVRAVILDQDERTVSIVILVEPTKGGTTCQGNPAFPFEVELGSPLGEREILDASVYPPEPQWP